MHWMLHAPVVFCERSGRWARAWRRAWSAANNTAQAARVVETRSPAECRDVLATASWPLAVVELTQAGCDEQLDLLFDATSVMHAATAAVTARDMAAYAELAGELGAVLVLDTPRRMRALCAVVCRHLERAPAVERTITEEIWATLPWGE